MSLRAGPLEPPQLRDVPETAVCPGAAGVALHLARGLASDQAERERRRARWERRRNRLIRSVERNRRWLGQLTSCGAVMLLLLLLAMLTGLAYSLYGLVTAGLLASLLLALLLLRTLMGAIGEAAGRELLRSACREGVELPEVRFD